MRKNKLLSEFPLMQQKYDYDCADASLWTVLHYFGSNMDYKTITKLAQTSPKDGTYNTNIIKMLQEINVVFRSGSVTVEELRRYAEENVPSIVDIQYRKENHKDWTDTWKNGHYVVVVYVSKKTIKYMDPIYGKIKSMPIELFKKKWHDEDMGMEYKNFAITCFSKESL
jgi:ABC-type bacteriocin/lantibiotic exporter with double-glycine peptidase domain